MVNENNEKCECNNEEKRRHKPQKPPKPECPPKNISSPIPCCDFETVCTNICGKIYLDSDVHKLVIWKSELSEKVTLTVSIFNSNWSTDSFQVIVARKEGSPVILNVPKRNTLSTTVEDAFWILVESDNCGIAEGTFCLEVCFPLRNKKT